MKQKREARFRHSGHTGIPPTDPPQITFTMHIPPAFKLFLKNGLDRIRKEVTAITATRIETGTPEGDALGFTESLFSGWLELQGKDRLYLHYIISRQKNEGNTQDLIRSWLARGYDVRVVMPRPVMQHILHKFRFEPGREYFPDQYEDEVEVWHQTGRMPESGRPQEEAVAAG
jgi:hypothetical protein